MKNGRVGLREFMMSVLPLELRLNSNALKRGLLFFYRPRWEEGEGIEVGGQKTVEKTREKVREKILRFIVV